MLNYNNFYLCRYYFKNIIFKYEVVKKETMNDKMSSNYQH